MIDKQIRREIEGAFRNYERWKDELAVKIADYQLAINPIEPSGRTKKNRASNKMEEQLLDILDSRQYRWCMVVESVLEYYRATGKDTLIRLRYFHNPKLSEYDVCDKLHISKSTMFSWAEEVLNYSHKYAIYERLLPPTSLLKKNEKFL